MTGHEKRRPQTTRLKRRCLLAALFKKAFGCVRASAHTVLVEPQTSSIRFSTKDCSTKACHRTQVRQAASRVTEGAATKGEVHPNRSSSERVSRHGDTKPRAQIEAKPVSRMCANARRGEHAHPDGNEELCPFENTRTDRAAPLGTLRCRALHGLRGTTTEQPFRTRPLRSLPSQNK